MCNWCNAEGITKGDDRSKQFALAKSINSEIKTIILYVNPSESGLLKIIKEYDRRLIEKGEKTAWLDLNNKVQKDRMQIPTFDEAD